MVYIPDENYKPQLEHLLLLVVALLIHMKAVPANHLVSPLSVESITAFKLLVDMAISYPGLCQSCAGQVPTPTSTSTLSSFNLQPSTPSASFAISFSSQN